MTASQHTPVADEARPEQAGDALVGTPGSGGRYM
jgi:hypothetical protein